MVVDTSNSGSDESVISTLDVRSQLNKVVKSASERDVTVKAGNRLYTQAIERQKRHEERRTQASETIVKAKTKFSPLIPVKNRQVFNTINNVSRLQSDKSRDNCELDENLDLTVKAGNRLYSNALRRMQVRNERSTETTATLKQLEDLIARAQNENDSSVMAGNRLYGQAIEQLKRQEFKRQEAMKPASRKLELITQTEIGKKVQTVSTEDIANRCDHLYHLSAEMQSIGKQRRSSIELAQARAKMKPETKILPASRAGDMYTRSMERLLMQKLKLEERYGRIEE